MLLISSSPTSESPESLVLPKRVINVKTSGRSNGGINVRADGKYVSGVEPMSQTLIELAKHLFTGTR